MKDIIITVLLSISASGACYAGFKGMKSYRKLRSTEIKLESNERR